MSAHRHEVARKALHTICAHVLGRRRFDVTGRFGLRCAPAGIATPAFGDAPEVVRVAGLTLVREVGADSTRIPINGSTLGDLAAFAQVDLSRPFDFGRDAPPVGDTDTPYELDRVGVGAIADWFALGWQVLDDVLSSVAGDSTGSTIQLWPEHFDAATTATLSSQARVNLGFSPGDGFEPEPYAYVGPWDDFRPGDAGFWNAPFGAAIRHSDLVASGDAAASCRRFLEEGLRRLGPPAGSSS